MKDGFHTRWLTGSFTHCCTPTRMLLLNLFTHPFFLSLLLSLADLVSSWPIQTSQSEKAFRWGFMLHPSVHSDKWATTVYQLCFQKTPKPHGHLETFVLAFHSNSGAAKSKKHLTIATCTRMSKFSSYKIIVMCRSFFPLSQTVGVLRQIIFCLFTHDKTN